MLLGHVRCRGRVLLFAGVRATGCTHQPWVLQHWNGPAVDRRRNRYVRRTPYIDASSLGAADCCGCADCRCAVLQRHGGQHLEQLPAAVRAGLPGAGPAAATRGATRAASGAAAAGRGRGDAAGVHAASCGTQGQTNMPAPAACCHAEQQHQQSCETRLCAFDGCRTFRVTELCSWATATRSWWSCLL